MAAKAGSRGAAARAIRRSVTTRERNQSAFDVVQLSNDAVNGLLNNEDIKDQPDGVRVLRSWSASGRSYQSWT